MRMVFVINLQVFHLILVDFAQISVLIQDLLSAHISKMIKHILKIREKDSFYR